MFYADQAGTATLDRTVSLPIHPLVTLELWVSALQMELLDGQLSPSQEARLLGQIERDPHAARMYDRALKDEALIMGLFSVASDREVA